MNFTKIAMLLAVNIIIAASPAKAQKEVGIAAIVGDSVISTVDLQERIKIAIFASNLPKGQGFEEKLLPQVLRGLIDEKLYMEEALALELAVYPDEIARVVADIEKRNSIQPGKFNEYMKQNGLSSAAMLEQIKSQLTWNKVIAKKVRPQVSVSDKEVDEKIEYLSKQSGVEEVNISEILLPVDSPKEDKKIKDIATKLAGQLKQEGDFSKIAKQFSKASTAENGGEVGWVRLGQLDGSTISAIKNMRAGEISSPIRLPEGYSIIRLNDRRALLTVPQEDASIGIKQAFVGVASGTTAETRKAIEDNIIKMGTSVKSCEAFDGFAKDIGSSIDSQLVTTSLSKIIPETKSLIRNLKIGEVSKPFISNEGIAVFMVCKRDQAKPELALNNKIRESMLMKKLEIQANSYLRDLRRGAFIEVRI